MSGDWERLRADQLHGQLGGRLVADEAELRQAALAYGWTPWALDDALQGLADRGELHQNLAGHVVIGKAGRAS